MKISWDQFHKLPVYTEAGNKIGLVHGVNIEIDAHAITHYLVMPGSIIQALYKRPLMIAPSQVVSISKEKMIVKNSAVREQSQPHRAETKLASAGSHAHLSEGESDI